MQSNIIFDSIKYIDEEGNEYWYARDLQKVFDYKEWRKFQAIIKRAIIGCETIEGSINNNFVQVDKIVKTGVATKKIIDYKLSRYACYLIALAGDERKEIIALAKSYFAYQTRKMELLDKQYNILSEDEKRLYNRNLIKKGNFSLNQTALNAGVKNFGEFHNFGYKGLYNGETADDIFKRKKLRYREDILDNMGSEELIANLFRISQTESKIIRDKIMGQDTANKIHYRVGKKVRKTIKELGGTMPENLKTPSKSIKELENKEDIFTITK